MEIGKWKIEEAEKENCNRNVTKKFIYRFMAINVLSRIEVQEIRIKNVLPVLMEENETKRNVI